MEKMGKVIFINPKNKIERKINNILRKNFADIKKEASKEKTNIPTEFQR